MWPLALLMELVISLTNALHPEERRSRSRPRSPGKKAATSPKTQRWAPFRAGALGAVTPLLLLLLLPEEAQLGLQSQFASGSLYAAWLPAMFSGTLLGGLLARYTAQTRPDNQVFLVGYIWGLIGALIPGILNLVFS